MISANSSLAEDVVLTPPVQNGLDSSFVGSIVVRNALSRDWFFGDELHFLLVSISENLSLSIFNRKLPSVMMCKRATRLRMQAKQEDLTGQFARVV